MPRTFSKTTIMDLINKSVRVARLVPDRKEAMFAALRDVIGLAITHKQFDDLVRTQGAKEPDAGVYRLTLWQVTEDSYDSWR